MHRIWLGISLGALLGCCGGVVDTLGAVSEKWAKLDAPTLTASGGRTCAIRDGRALCWGSNVQGGLRPDAPPAVRAPLYAPFEQGVRQVVPLEAATCAVTAEREVRCVGIHPRSILDTEGLANVTWLEGGRGYACAVHDEGAVSCWGVGAPGSQRRHERFRVEGIDDATQLSSGNAHMCALKRDGSVACWGDNRHGQLGDGSTDSHDTPGPVAYPGDDVVQIALGAFHSCLLTRAGEVRCWGRSQLGQVDGTVEPNRPEPREVPVPRAHLIAAGGDVSCAATDDGVWCWGNATCGQRGTEPEEGCGVRRVGDGEAEPRRALEGDVDALAVGLLHVCARRDGETLCWGGDDAGQLGRGATEGMTRGGSCHPRAALCASEQPRPVAEPTDDPTALPVGDGIEWRPPLSFAEAPRPPDHEVRFEVLEADGFDPERLAEVLTMTMRMPSLACYRRLGDTPEPRTIELTVEEQGADIPDVTAVDDPTETLTRCYRATVARGYFSVSGEGSFRLRATFTPDGWDGLI